MVIVEDVNAGTLLRTGLGGVYITTFLVIAEEFHIGPPSIRVEFRGIP